MGKSKAIFKLKKGESVVFQAHANFCATGKYSHAILGDALLTDRRFLFQSDLKLTRVNQSFEISLSDIDFVCKTGIPLLTRSLYISCSTHTGKNYRFNVYSLRKWLKAFGKILPNKSS